MASLPGTRTPAPGAVSERVPGAEYLYLFFLFPAISLFIWDGLYYVSLAFLVAGLFALVVLSERLRVSSSFVAVTLLYALFLLYAAITMLWSSSSQYAAFKFIRLAVMCTLLVVVPTVLFPDERRMYNFFKFSIYASVLVAVVIIYGYFSPDYARPFQLFGSASHIRPGRIIGYGIVVTAFYTVSARRRPRRYVYLLMLGVLLAGITVSESRGPLVAAVLSVGLVLFLTYYVTRDRKDRAYQLVLASIAAVVALFVLHVSFAVTVPNLDRIIPILQGDLDPSSRHRLEFYRQAVAMWVQDPVFGKGLGSFAVEYFGADTQGYPHNIVLEILFELGLVGLVLFGAVVAVALRPLAANHGDHPIAILLFCVLVYALLNASVSKDLQGNRLVFAVIGLSVTLELLPSHDR